MAVGWFFDSIICLDAGSLGIDCQRRELVSSCADALAFVAVTFSSVVRRDHLFILAVVADSEDSKDEVTPCCLTHHWSQRRLRRSVCAAVFGLAGVTGGVAQFLVVRPHHML